MVYLTKESDKLWKIRLLGTWGFYHPEVPCFAVPFSTRPLKKGKRGCQLGHLGTWRSVQWYRASRRVISAAQISASTVIPKAAEHIRCGASSPRNRSSVMENQGSIPSDYINRLGGLVINFEMDFENLGVFFFFWDVILKGSAPACPPKRYQLIQQEQLPP